MQGNFNLYMSTLDGGVCDSGMDPTKGSKCDTARECQNRNGTRIVRATPKFA
jgi:hypothetical protein